MAQNDELLFRQMPHSLEAEQAALGAILNNADCLKDVKDQLQPEDFYIKQNREVFETIYTMFSFSKPIDGVTVAEEMQKNGTYDDQTTRSSQGLNHQPKNIHGGIHGSSYMCSIGWPYLASM